MPRQMVGKDQTGSKFVVNLRDVHCQSAVFGLVMTPVQLGLDL